MRYDDKATICTSITKINLTRRHNKFMNNIQCLVILYVYMYCETDDVWFHGVVILYQNTAEHRSDSMNSKTKIRKYQ